MLAARLKTKMPLSTTDLLANINHKFSVLAITETWVKESNVNDLSFEGYNFVSNHRANKIGGGVGLLPLVVTKGNKNCYITGDFNLDLLKHESHSVTAQFIESLFAFSFLPMITKPQELQHIPRRL